MNEFELQKKMNLLAEQGRATAGQAGFEAAWRFIELWPSELRKQISVGVNSEGALVMNAWTGINSIFMSFGSDGDDDVIRVSWIVDSQTKSFDALNFIVSEEDTDRVLRLFKFDIERTFAPVDTPYPYVQ
jgi:hypothetical protein